MADVDAGFPQSADYELVEHRHRFAVWAAARAAQRRLAGGSTPNFSAAIEACGVVEFAAAGAGAWPSTAGMFDDLHRTWCNKLVSSLRAGGAVKATYGHAAKAVAIYLKSMVVNAGFEDTELAKNLHPPVDSILLKSLARDSRFSRESRHLWDGTTWTELDESAYFRLIESFRREGLNIPAFWFIERYWTFASPRA